MNPEDHALARSAVTAMRDELQAYPKPGLVSPVDSGAHADMDFELMCRSADSLLQPFAALAAAGRAALPFEQALVPLGIEAERGMLLATGGVNTHRGAIFSVGLIVAAIARAQDLSANLSPASVRAALKDTWGDALEAHAASDGETSHGALVRRQTGRDGARREAARAFPGVFETGLPAYRAALQAGLDASAASIQTLFALMSSIDDTTVLYRGGLEAGSFVRQSATDFLADGGCHQPGWFEKAEALHRAFIARNLSAGGCADLLACTLLVARYCEAT
ncbi:MAG: triphosphoribosyl-dephospho-CoA synthase MdcB [Reyranella sp.]|nr:triphosphoribosyl-dephospho-CoA synthase MdcB [Reyranella sp.]